MRAGILLSGVLLLMIGSVAVGGQPSPSVKCIWADIASNPGETQMHDGSCQQCGTDGQWFDVQGVKCPGCTASGDGHKGSGSYQKRVAAEPHFVADSNYCFDSADRTYSIGALRFTSRCLRCDSHGTFSQDNESNCKVCRH
jgi:hypothetical protein